MKRLRPDFEPARGNPAFRRLDQITAAIALNTLTGRVTMLVGRALAGVITGAFGIALIFPALTRYRTSAGKAANQAQADSLRP